MKDKPTDTQREEFWKGYGFKVQTVWPDYADLEKVLKWTYPDGSYHKECPPIDPNSLFTWAVPKLQVNGYEISVTYDPFSKLWNVILFATVKPFQDYNTTDKDPALALFWALQEAIGQDMNKHLTKDFI